MSRPRTVDASELLAQIEGLSDSAAGRACNVDRTTIRRWRRTGRASPGVLAETLHHLNNPDSLAVRRRQGQPRWRPARYHGADIHAHATWTPTGWILDAYRIHDDPAIIDPIDTVAVAAATGPRWPTLADAHRHARRRFGARLAVLTPLPFDQEATA